jgi:hypothetical protein
LAVGGLAAAGHSEAQASTTRRWLGAASPG